MAPSAAVELRVRDVIAEIRYRNPTTSTRQVRDLLESPHGIRLSLDEVKQIQARYGLDAVTKHKPSGRFVGPAGPHTLSDLIIFAPDDSVTFAWACSWCDRIGSASSFVMCRLCRGTGARPAAWCKETDCFDRDARHRAVCSSLIGYLPRPDPSRHSVRALWQIQLQCDAITTSKQALLADPDDGRILTVSDYYFDAAICQLLRIPHGLRQPRLQIGWISRVEFRQSYAAALEQSMFSLEDRRASVRSVLESIGTGSIDGRPIAALPEYASLLKLLRAQLQAELGIDPCDPNTGSCFAPFEALDLRDILDNHAGTAVPKPKVGQKVIMADGSSIVFTKHMEAGWRGEQRDDDSIVGMLKIGSPAAMHIMQNALRQGVFPVGPGFARDPAAGPLQRTAIWGPWHATRFTTARKEALQAVLTANSHNARFASTVHRTIWRLSGSDGSPATGPTYKLDQLAEPVARQLHHLIFHDRSIWHDAWGLPPPEPMAPTSADARASTSALALPASGIGAQLLYTSEGRPVLDEHGRHMSTNVVAGADPSLASEAIKAAVQRLYPGSDISVDIDTTPGKLASGMDVAGFASIGIGDAPGPVEPPSAAIASAQARIENRDAVHLPSAPSKVKAKARKRAKKPTAPPAASSAAPNDGGSHQGSDARVDAGAAPPSASPRRLSSPPATQPRPPAAQAPAAASLPETSTPPTPTPARPAQPSPPPKPAAAARSPSSARSTSSAGVTESAAKIRGEIWKLLAGMQGLALVEATRLLERADAEATPSDARKTKANASAQALHAVRTQISQLVEVRD